MDGLVMRAVRHLVINIDSQISVLVIYSWVIEGNYYFISQIYPPQYVTSKEDDNDNNELMGRFH